MGYLVFKVSICGKDINVTVGHPHTFRFVGLLWLMELIVPEDPWKTRNCGDILTLLSFSH